MNTGKRLARFTFFPHRQLCFCEWSCSLYVSFINFRKWHYFFIEIQRNFWKIEIFSLADKKHSFSGLWQSHTGTIEKKYLSFVSDFFQFFDYIFCVDFCISNQHSFYIFCNSNFWSQKIYQINPFKE